MPMVPRHPQRNTIRFDVFEVDIATGELRKNGLKIKLQEQPFQVLVMLLERPREIITREEIRNRLWGGDTFVDFDQSLNTAINKVREALGDSATNPKYVETLARKGYRFLAAIKQNIAVEEVTPAQTTLDPNLDVASPHRALVRSLFGLIQIMYMVFYLEALFRLAGIEHIADSSLPGLGPIIVEALVVITAGIGIPLRFYLLSAIGFDFRQLGIKFSKLFPFVLALDGIWAVSPFLLIDKLGFGMAFAATAALLYVPFSERTLVRMAYPIDSAGVAK